MREFGFSELNTNVSTDIHFLACKNYESIDFEELLDIFIQSDVAVYFVMNMRKADYNYEYHLNSVTKQSTRLQCLHINDLADFYPLPLYIVNGLQVIPLKHSVFSE